MAGAFAIGGAAMGQERPSTLRMSCEEITALVGTGGAVVVGTGPVSYERIVRDGGFCDRDQNTAPVYLPTRNAPSCFVGYRCRDTSRGEGRSDG